MIRISRWIVSLIGLLAVTAAFAAPAKFNLPAQPAPAALQAFIKQSDMQVMYLYDELKVVRTNEVIGEMEPAEALAKLFESTGYRATKKGAGFVVEKAAPAKTTTGSVRGTLLKGLGVPSEDIRVIVRETGQQARTDKDGEFFFSSVEPGTYLLVATADGFQPLHITDVVVRAGYEVSLSREELHSANGTLTLEPFVVKAESVEQLEKFEVIGEKPKPFSDRNVDLPRTINDVQPYYLFDSKSISQSGAVDIDDFLKQRLTMNTVALTNGQLAGNFAGNGNTSSINLRGLGTNETLILVNGRRVAGVTIQGAGGQPDLNGIPLSAIERIEVLPSSASGIYGGSAVGGVVNVVLKKDYTGGEIRATYDNTWDTDAPRRTVSASFGQSLEGGRTHFSLQAQWSNVRPLLVQDRREFLENGVHLVLARAPTVLNSSSTPFLGALPNIRTASPFLILKDGTVLSSKITYVPAGTTSSTPTSTLIAGLVANLGKWDFNLPAANETPTGLLQPIGGGPTTRSIRAAIDRQMFPNLQLFGDFSFDQNSTATQFNRFSVLSVRATAPSNPFNNTVTISFPSVANSPLTTKSETRAFTMGAIAKLPWRWTGEFDYSWSENRFHNDNMSRDSTVQTADVTSGLLDYFVDSLANPIDLSKYLYKTTGFTGSSKLDDFALRASGPLKSLPWGEPTLTIGLEDRIAKVPTTFYTDIPPLTPTNGATVIYYKQRQHTDSVYAELLAPLIAQDWLPLVHALELQLSCRGERFTVGTGTASQTISFTIPPFTSYSGPTLNGQPYFANTKYTSKNFTVGLKYQPVPDVTVRVSYATAFLPPTPDQLVKNPLPDQNQQSITDPKTGNSILIQTISGGNPDLKPQHSKSFNVGVIWEPTRGILEGLRLDAEYYKIDQFDAISSLSADLIVTQENLFPGRVTRDASGTITLVDTSLVNLFKLETEGWDLSANYRLKTRIGTFNLQAVESIILHLKSQYAQAIPEADEVNYPSEGGAAKYKTNAVLKWEHGRWLAGWTTRYFGSYKQWGATGGGFSDRFAGGAVYLNGGAFVPAQGSEHVPGQIYHDLFVSYDFGENADVSYKGNRSASNHVLDGLTIQFGVKDLFNAKPPFDAYYLRNYFVSPYGDTRLRSYWITLKKIF